MQLATGLRRLGAYALDYLLIAVYAAALFMLVTFVLPAPRIEGPWAGQLVGFLSLTLPVGLYFALAEASRWRGTVGKRVLRLQVVDLAGERLGLGASIRRSAVKFLPWEVAHLGVHQIAPPARA